MDRVRKLKIRASVSLEERASPVHEVDPKSNYYLLNPGGDLSETEKRFRSMFEDEWRWEGYSGEPRDHKELSKVLTERSVYIYIGHSGGEQYIPGWRIKRLNVRATALIMGCSSGLMKSNGAYEPTGIVNNYLTAGCPSIVANLWDITDKDIDKFSRHMLEKWMEGKHSLPRVVTLSRKVCKLKYLTGAAPVCYGIPARIVREGVG